MRLILFMLAFAATGSVSADERLIPLFEKSDLLICKVLSSYSCHVDRGCESFGPAKDPLVDDDGNLIVIDFAARSMKRLSWSVRKITFDADGIYTIVRSDWAKDTIYMRITNKQRDFVEAMTTSDEWTITSFGTCSIS